MQNAVYNVHDDAVLTLDVLLENARLDAWIPV
jgi:hypothetical protein